MDFVEVVIDGPIDVDRDDIEDELESALGDRGAVTGAGTGRFGSNLDLEIEPGADRQEILESIVSVLERIGVGDSVRVRPGDGELWIRLSDWPT